MYVGSAESDKYDQVLDTVFVGPVARGQYRFVFQARACIARAATVQFPAAPPATSEGCRRAACRAGPDRQRPDCQPAAPCVQADPPDFSRIPPDDVVGVTIILLTCSFKDQARRPARRLRRACAPQPRSAGQSAACSPLTAHSPRLPSPPLPSHCPHLALAGVHPRGVLCQHRLCRCCPEGRPTRRPCHRQVSRALARQRAPGAGPIGRGRRRRAPTLRAAARSGIGGGWRLVLTTGAALCCVAGSCAACWPTSPG